MSTSKPKAVAHKSTKSPKKKAPGAKTKQALLMDTATMPVVLPTSLLESTNIKAECSVLVQIDPKDATRLDFEGQTGAIGRLDSNNSGITLDLKGMQYHGTIHPGPTALVVSVMKTGELKVDAITDEFVTLTETQNVMAKLNAVVQGEFDNSYDIVEEDVNRRTRVIDEALTAAANPAVKKKKRKKS
mmetsp:Transcript_12638/g.22963  ORF Transcript_12638/g.22963 Transcript_12638/m.22963 type:complete len:187 (-) Transcript_12638:956-1516(-)